MTVRRAKPISQLYREVADYDLVVTVDAPLSHALNRRLETPHLGRFAATPRMIASGEFRPTDERRLFVDLIESTELGWKEAAYAREVILGCWEETGEVAAVLDFDRFDTPAIRTALSVVREADSAHHDLAVYTPDESQSVAVIGLDQFTALDKQVLPTDYDIVSPFAEGAFTLPAFHVYESTTAIVEAVTEQVTPANAEEVAVVVDPGSEYATLLTSAFDADGIPYYGGPTFAESEGVRTYVGLLRTAVGGDGLALRAVGPVLAALGIESPTVDDHKRFCDLDHPDLQPVQAFCRSVGDASFGDVVSTVESWTDRSLDALRDELDRLSLHDQPVTEARLDRLVWYLQSFEVPVDREDSGVLLADPASAAVVDRPLVFSLGVDADWTHRIPDRPWVDRERHDRRNRQQFQRLLQNGSQQYYLVRDTAGGNPVSPCLYFRDLLDTEFERFTDLPHVVHTREATVGSTGFAAPDLAVDGEPIDPKPIETLSPSSLNTLANSPRDYQFDRLIESAERDYLRKGTLYHDFAECFVTHPDLVADADREALVDHLLSELRPFVSGPRLELLRTEFTVGLDIIETFLRESPPTDHAVDAYSSAPSDNVVADYLDCELDSSLTEQWFENPALGGKGKIDLVHSPTRLLDYKSGAATTASKVVSQSSTDPVDDEPNFQAISYLAEHRRHQPNEPLEFVFFHFLDLVDDALTGSFDPSDALVRVSYHPSTFVEYAGSRGAFEALRSGVAESNDRRKTLNKLGYDAYASVFDSHPMPETESTDELLDSAFAEALTTRAVSAVGDYKYVTGGIESALKKLCSLRGEQYFADDLDAFEGYLRAQVDRVNDYRECGFPVGEPNADRLAHRDLIRTEDRDPISTEDRDLIGAEEGDR